MANENNKGACVVTGAGGYVASWLVKLLLSHGYTVHGTLRNPEDNRHDHLKNLENAAERLKLYKADLLDYESIRAAVMGCDGVFHVACPVPSTSVPNPEEEVVKPAVDGTLNILKACSEAKVKRVVIVSSGAAISMNPNWPMDREMDETCWSDAAYCKTTNNWYCYSKTTAEAGAVEYGKRTGLDVITVCPFLVFGPMLQPTMNSSSLVVVKLLKEGFEELENKARTVVDVRDVAEALKFVYENPQAEGRYLCLAHKTTSQEMVQILRDLYPEYNYPKRFKEGKNEQARATSEKLQRLGWKYRPLKDTLVDSVHSYKQLGFLQ